MSIEKIIQSLTPIIGPPRTVELGKIKIGGLGEVRRTKEGREWRLPRKDDFFTITSVARDAHGDLIPDQALMAALIQDHGSPDGKLRQLPIRLLSDNIEHVLQARFCWYGKRLAGAVSDGETVTWKYEPDTFQPIVPPRKEAWKDEMLAWTDQRGNKLFKLHANFSCTIYSQDGRWGGAYVFRTTSVISFRQLYASLLEVADKTGGVLLGIPLWLCVRPMQVSPEGKTSTVYVVHLEIRGQDLQDLQRIALEQAEFRLKFASGIQRFERAYQKLLAPPGDETPEEAAEIAAEFVPDIPPEGILPDEHPPAESPPQSKVEEMAARLRQRQEPQPTKPPAETATTNPDEALAQIAQALRLPDPIQGQIALARIREGLAASGLDESGFLADTQLVQECANPTPPPQTAPAADQTVSQVAPEPPPDTEQKQVDAQDAKIEWENRVAAIESLAGCEEFRTKVLPTVPEALRPAILEVLVMQQLGMEESIVACQKIKHDRPDLAGMANARIADIRTRRQQGAS